MTNIISSYPESLKRKKEMDAQSNLPIKFISNSEIDKKMENTSEIEEELTISEEELKYFEDTDKSDWEIGFLRRREIITSDNDNNLMPIDNIQISKSQSSIDKKNFFNIVQKQFEKTNEY